MNSFFELVKLKNSNWVRGNYKGLLFFAKVFKDASEYGINNGKTSKLTVYAGNNVFGSDRIIYNYDRGIDVDNPIGNEIAEKLESIDLDNVPEEQ